MFQFLTEDILVMLGVRVYQKKVGIPMDTNCALRFSDLFLYSYD